MLVIFPFEEAIYRAAGVPVTFVGHPLVDLVQPLADPPAFLRSIGLDPARPVVAVLPGSRPQEVAHNLPPLAGGIERLARKRPDLQFLLALAPSLDPAAVRAALGPQPVSLVVGRTHAVLSAATLGLVASGTATVEAAILGTPMVVVYRISPLSWAVGRHMVRVAHAAMPNLIAGREVVKELIQGALRPERVAEEALALLDDPARLAQVRADLAQVRQGLGGQGASERAAAAVLQVLFQTQDKKC
jgi:lipid-A-disaccharide synthase